MVVPLQGFQTINDQAEMDYWQDQMKNDELFVQFMIEIFKKKQLEAQRGRRNNCMTHPTLIPNTSSPPTAQEPTIDILQFMPKTVPKTTVSTSQNPSFLEYNSEFTRIATLTCWSCTKQFKYAQYPMCNVANIWKGTDYQCGQKRTCFKFKKSFQHMNCPHCTETNYLSNETYYQEDPISCWTCKKIFQLLNCFSCKTALYYVNGTYKSGLIRISYL
ncbi:unnamed protein product [Adineta ricciae]|uniref:Uncharacterized protein n=1 Tax=Adineta ricciae TaxID=249248 RepID=A0A814I1H1_ADIRI|nr:unnamed protein product [Adineta ricciae]CAF1510097.1 unnamed protein product [Adineta ricciae]